MAAPQGDIRVHREAIMQVVQKAIVGGAEKRSCCCLSP